jgi:hypothetical protein
MRMLSRRLPVAAILAGSVLAALVPGAAAHSGIEVGEYLLTIGWRNEPAFVGQPNAVQVTIVHHDDDSPVTDLAADALTVTVSTAAVDSPSLALEPAFDAAEGTGRQGEYGAALVPTAPGGYAFHITGSIHGTAVDVTLASGADTFDPVVGSGDLEFPVKLPSLDEVATHLDRIDARIAALQSAAPGSEALSVAQDAAAGARAAAASADRALLVGAVLGGAGLVLALAALVVVVRAGQRGSGRA